MYKHVVNVLLSDIIYIITNNKISSIDTLDDILYPGDQGMFDYNKSKPISLTERFLLFHNEQLIL